MSYTKQYRMMTQVNIKVKWLRLSQTSENEENNKYKTCNLLMRYNQEMSSETLSKLTIESRSSPIGKDNDIIDFRSFMMVGEMAHSLGKNKPIEIGQMIPPISHAIFDEIFNNTQRREYISYESMRPVTSNVRAMANHLLPHSIVFPDYLTRENLPVNNVNSMHAALLHGYTIDGDGLHLPTHALYNYDLLDGSPSEQSGSVLGLYMVMGPGNDLLCGENIGTRGGMDKANPLHAKFTTKLRTVQDAAKKPYVVGDQKVAVCFYLAREKETHDAVADDLIRVCKAHTQSRLTDMQSKDLAVIKLGTMLLDNERSHSVNYTSDGVQVVVLNSFRFAPDLRWKVYPFSYSKNDRNLSDGQVVNQASLQNTHDYSGVSVFNTTPQQLYSERERDDGAGPSGVANYTMQKRDDGAGLSSVANYTMPMQELLGVAGSDKMDGDMYGKVVYTAMPEEGSEKTLSKALTKMKYSGKESKGAKSKVKGSGSKKDLDQF